MTANTSPPTAARSEAADTGSTPPRRRKKPENLPRAHYHHGDLPRVLLETAVQMVRETGIEALSLRALAKRVGVSQSALYHHFQDKQALLCAIGGHALCRFRSEVQAMLDDTGAAPEQRFERYISAYVQFALSNPELYELMLGRSTWRAAGGATVSFRAAALENFRVYAAGIERLQREGLLSAELNPLRMAQVIWGTLHGLCRMYIDGLEFTPRDVEEIGQYARWLLGRAEQRPRAPQPASVKRAGRRTKSL